ncbi:MAG: ABC transporter ATP-binding protein [Dehalococcoidia bacterium]
MPTIIEARGLVKMYGDFQAVAGIDLTVQEGEVFGILGPNGAGKTSVVRMISCVLPISGGELSVDGLDARYDDRKIKARLGVVPQDDNLDQDLSVRQNLEVYARFFDIPKAVAAERIVDGLRLMQLGDRADGPIQALSGGMKRRLVIARALVSQPRLLVLDEPTTGLDPQARHLVWRKLRLLREQGVSILLTTHYMDEAEQLCDRLVIMDEGKILEIGRPRDLVAQHVGSTVLEMRLLPEEEARVRSYLQPATLNGSRVEQIEDILYAYGLTEEQTRGVTSLIGDPLRVLDRRANLEDVFLSLTGRILEE